MFYPTEFKEKVKKAFPNWDELHRSLDEGDVFVGRYLDDNCTTSLSINTIMAATSLKELQDKARTELEKVELYNEWSRLYNEQNPH